MERVEIERAKTIRNMHIRLIPGINFNVRKVKSIHLYSFAFLNSKDSLSILHPMASFMFCHYYINYKRKIHVLPDWNRSRGMNGSCWKGWGGGGGGAARRGGMDM